jgi:hypothetical protein
MKIQVLVLTFFPMSTKGHTYLHPESLVKLVSGVRELDGLPIISGTSNDIQCHRIMTTDSLHRVSHSCVYTHLERSVLSASPVPEIEDDVLELLKYIKPKHYIKEIMRTVPTIYQRYKTHIRPGLSIRKGKLNITENIISDNLRRGDKEVNSFIICLSGDDEAVQMINKCRNNEDFVPTKTMDEIIEQYKSSLTLPRPIQSMESI